nr:labyrinthopeptin A2 prepropeptide [Actinomadura namibiensis]
MASILELQNLDVEHARGENRSDWSLWECCSTGSLFACC